MIDAVYATGNGDGDGGDNGTDTAGSSDSNTSVVPALEFVTQPSLTLEGAAISPVEIQLKQSSGAVVADFEGEINLELLTHASGGELSGTLVKSAVAGKAVFNELKIDQAATGYQIKASTTGFAGITSVPFNIRPSTYDGAVALNMPTDVRYGSSFPILPVAAGPLINAGTSQALRGMDNAVGPFAGVSPHAGAHQPEVGLPWYGIRSFTDYLAYGLPDGWKVMKQSDISKYADVGAPSSIGTEAFRLFIVQDTPAKAFLLVTFKPLTGEARWSMHNGQLGSGYAHYRDGLGAKFTINGNKAKFIGSRVGAAGVTTVVGGVLQSQRADAEGDMYQFVRSLYYEWNLPMPGNAPTLAVPAPPAHGVVPIGTPVVEDYNALTADARAGQLGGDVTLTSASINWQISGDALVDPNNSNINTNTDSNLTAHFQFRRKGTTEWRDALDPFRSVLRPEKNAYHKEFGNSIVKNNISGSIFGLAPGTTYDLKASFTDPDGGSGSLQTTFTTRSEPRVSGRVIEVRPTDSLSTIEEGFQPGDTYLLHAGNYNNNEYWGLKKNKSGSPGNPVLIRPYGDGDVKFRSITVKFSNHIWFDGLHTLTGIHGNKDENTSYISATRNVIDSSTMDPGTSYHGIDSDGTGWFISDNLIIGSNPPPGSYYGEGIEFAGRGHVAAFNDISKVGDGMSYGQGNIDIHNNLFHDTKDDTIEPDYSEDNYRVFENLGYQGGNHGFSFQPNWGGPIYCLRNQITGPYMLFKLRSALGARVIIGNSLVHKAPNQDVGELFTKDSIFANNFWAVMPQKTGSWDIGYGVFQVAPPRLRDYNIYDADPNNVFRKYSLDRMHSSGVELNSMVVDAVPNK